MCSVFCFVCLPLVYIHYVGPVSLDCPFFISRSVFSNVILCQQLGEYRDETRGLTVLHAKDIDMVIVR